jgi:hypothetical protein
LSAQKIIVDLISYPDFIIAVDCPYKNSMVDLLPCKKILVLSRSKLYAFWAVFSAGHLLIY